MSPARPPAPGSPALNARNAARLAGDLLQRLLGSRPRRVERLAGGRTNFVMAARHGGQDLVVRMNADPAKLGEYLKEQWAIGRAARAGLPVPEVLEVGASAAHFPYMIARQVPGEEGTHHPDRPRILRELGQLARRLHRVRTTGFGHSFDWSHNQLSRNDTWAEYLDREFQGARRLEVLAKHAMLSGPGLKVLRATLAELSAWQPRPVLHHGDLRLKNVIVGADGRIAALIDWEFCTSNPAPFWDLSIALHDLSVDAKEDFLAGYGMQPAEVQEAMPVLRTFNVLNYAGAVETAARENDRAALARLRLRLHGWLDMYAF